MIHSRWKKKLLLLAVVSAVLFGLVRTYYHLTDDFRLANISYEMPYHSEWNTALLSPADKKILDEILSQKFFYIGKGAQSYAFASADGNYVIKFFKFKHLKPSLLTEMLPPLPPFARYRQSQSQRKKRKLDGVFAGYHLAYNVHKEDAGLLYVHLNKTQKEHQTAHLYDKIGRLHEISLDDVVFIVQKKGSTLRDVISKLAAQQDLATAKKRLNQIFDLYLSEYQKGIYDHDHGVMHNTGFVGDKPIHLDVGKLKRNEEMKSPTVYLPDLELVAKKMENWLRENLPAFHSQLTAEIEAKMSAIAGHPYRLSADAEK